MISISHSLQRGFCFGLFCTMMVFLCACHTNIDGQIYVDENNNGKLDDTEIGIPYAKISVTRDGSLAAQAYSDFDGYFNIPIQRRPGNICLTTDLSFAEDNVRFVEASNQQIRAKGYYLPDPTVTTSPTASTEEEEEAEEEEPQGVVSTPPGPEGWVGEKFCKNIQSSGFTAVIPVSLDYAAVLSNIPKRQKIVLYAGDEGEISIAAPDGCDIKTITLPDGIEPVGQQAGLLINTSLNTVSFKESSAQVVGSSQKTQTAAASETETIPQLSISTYHVRTVKIRAQSDLPIGTTSHTINPVAECAEQELNLPEIPLELVRDVDVEISQDLRTTSQLEAGDTTSIEIEVKNQGKSVVTGGSLTLTPPEDAELLNLPGNCDNYGKTQKCETGDIASSESYILNLKFRLPDLSSYASGDTEEFTCEAKFEADGMDREIKAEKVRFDVKKP